MPRGVSPRETRSRAARTFSAGATLAANGLKILSDGLILKSQAHLAAALGASWDAAQFASCRRLLSIFEARARGRSVVSLSWPAAQDDRARACAAPYARSGADARAHGVLIDRARLFAATGALTEAGLGPISVERPAYVFEATCEPADRLAAALKV